MKYKLTICDYDEVRKFTIKGFVIFILTLVLVILLFTIISYQERIFSLLLFLTTTFFAIFIIRGASKLTSKEELILQDNMIISSRFGNIKFGEITSYNYEEYKGTSALVLNLKDKRRLGIGSRNKISGSVNKDYTDFLNAFETQFSNYSPAGLQ